MKLLVMWEKGREGGPIARARFGLDDPKRGGKIVLPRRPWVPEIGSACWVELEDRGRFYLGTPVRCPCGKVATQAHEAPGGEVYCCGRPECLAAAVRARKEWLSELRRKNSENQALAVGVRANFLHYGSFRKEPVEARFPERRVSMKSGIVEAADPVWEAAARELLAAAELEAARRGWERLKPATWRNERGWQVVLVDPEVVLRVEEDEEGWDGGTYWKETSRPFPYEVALEKLAVQAGCGHWTVRPSVAPEGWVPPRCLACGQKEV